MSEARGKKKNKRGQKPALAKCTNRAQDEKKAGGRTSSRGIKRCRSSLDDHHHQQQQNQQQQVFEKSLCLVLTDTHAIGCDAVYAVNLDDGNDFQERNFCKNCSVQLFGKHDGGETKPEPVVDSGFREITPSLSSESKPHGEMFASVGSYAYVLGGPFRKPKLAVERKPGETVNLFSRKVFYFDANNQQEGWKRGPDMLVARDFNGKALSLDGKIYVLGGLDGLHEGRSVVASPPEPWGEVFDPVKNEWKPLTPLPDYIDRDAYSYGPVVTYGLEGDKKIIIGGHDYGRYAYHVKSGTWEEFEPEISYPEGVKPLGVGNVLYWTDAGKLQAVNMKNGRRYRGRIKGSGLRVQGHECLDCFHLPEPELFHLGGKKFCFFTLHAIRGGRTKVRCSKFEVSKCLRPPPPDTHNYGYLKAAVNSRVTYVLDRPLESFTALGLLLDGIPDVASGRKCSKAADDEVEEKWS